MDEIKIFIIQQTNLLSKNFLRRNSRGKTITIENFNTWINSIKTSMRCCKYREALKIIEGNKKIFLNNKDSWKFEILEIECILKIIKKKLSKYSEEIINGNPHQCHSILFWFNRIFYLLEFLTLKIRPDINSTIVLNEENNLNIIEYIIQVHLNTLYTLCLYSRLIGEIPELCSYFAMAERLFSFVYYIRSPKTLNLFQRILLLRANLFIENLDFENSLKYQKLSNDICFREFFFLIDFDAGLNSSHIEGSKKHINFIYNNIINMVLCFYLRGVCFEIFGNIKLSIEAYKQGRWLCEKFLTKKQPEFTFFMKKIEKRNFIYYNILQDIEKELEMIQSEKYNKEEERIKKIEQNKYEERECSEIFKKISSGKSIKNSSGLENILEKIGIMQLNDIENDKYYLGKSKKSKFILSTISTINNLLSNDFSDILRNMKKIEINNMDNNIKKVIYKRLVDVENKRNKSLFSSFSSNNMSKNLVKLKSPRSLNKNITYVKSDNENNNQNKKEKMNVYDNYQKYTMKNNRRKSSILKKRKEKINSFMTHVNLSKINIEKKNFLEKLSKKEIDFHKQNLYAKRFEIEKDIEKFDRKKVNSDAENTFNLKLILAQHQVHKKNSLKTLIKNNITSEMRNLQDSIKFEPLSSNDINKKKSRLSITSQSFFTNFKNINNSIKADKNSVNSRNLDIIKQLNKETNYINKSIKEKHKLIKSCSLDYIKPRIYLTKKEK